MDISLGELLELVMDREAGVLRFMGSQRVGGGCVILQVEEVVLPGSSPQQPANFGKCAEVKLLPLLLLKRSLEYERETQTHNCFCSRCYELTQQVQNEEQRQGETSSVWHLY